MNITVTAPTGRTWNPNTALQQIGRSTVLAISGGRTKIENGNLILPVSNGYCVEIEYDWTDTYVVRRIFKRGDKRWVKGEVREVYAFNLSEVAYQASCFRDGEWPVAP